jgi:hypothetical protein
MKKLLMLLVTGVTYTSLITNPVAAQVASTISYPIAAGGAGANADEEKPAVKNNVEAIDKTTLKEKRAELKAAKASLKISNDFNKNFSGAGDVKWNTEEKAIIATFKKDERSTRVVYDKSGSRVYSIVTYFNENLMPAEARAKVKSAYEDFDITLVQEIYQSGILVYLVHLEDARNFKQVLISGDEITMYREFKKSK